MSKLVGLVGWRGMVGSVLMDRMIQEKDFDLIEPLFFSTSNAGGKAPAMAKNETTLQDAFNIEQLKRCEIIITAQGGDYTTEVFPKLRAAGWNGHWIDAASTLRMEKDAVIILDPVNMPVIKNALAQGGNNWVGGNCTVSCMLMGVGALYKAGLVEWMSTQTYQAASGGGAQHMRELLTQYGTLNAEVKALLDDPKSAILEIDRLVVAKQRALTASETANFGVPLGGSLIRGSFIKDGSLFASSGGSGDCKVWSIPECELRTKLMGHVGRVNDIKFHPNALNASTHEVYGKIATASSDNTVRLWTMDFERSIQKNLILKGHEDRVNRILFHNLGTHLISCSHDKTWRFWDMERRKDLIVQTGHSKPIYTSSLHPDGSLLVIFVY